MRKSTRSKIVGFSLVITGLSACGGSGNGGGGVPPSPSASTPIPIVADHEVSTGDTFGARGTAWDITNVKTTVYGDGNALSPSDYDYLRVDVTFAQSISAALPAPGQALSLGSQLGISVDIASSPTSVESTAPFSCITQVSQAFNFGSLSSPRLADGNYDVADASGTSISQPGNVISEAQTSVNGNTISQIFRIGTLGDPETSTAPLLGVAVSAGNGDTNPGISPATETDCAPRNVALYLTQ